MNHLALLALSLAPLAACGSPPNEAPASDAAATNQEHVAPVVLNIGIDQLHVARFELDLRANIARFMEPAASLPLDRVVIFGQGPDETPEHLDDVVSRCYEVFGYDVTGGTAFIIGQGEDLLTTLTANGSECAECGAVVICVGMCAELGPGEVPRADPATYDTDPPEGDTGVDNGSGDGESGGSGSGNDGDRSGGDSGSGADSGGNGGSHGGVGQPGGGEGGGGWD